MYFNAETQSRILDRFGFALADDGYLFLGKAETLLTQSSRFTPVDLRLRIFAKTHDIGRRVTPPAVRAQPDGDGGPTIDLTVLALDEVPVPMVVVNASGDVVSATAAARALFGLRAKDIGSPLQNLELSYRPLELRSILGDALAERRTIERKAVRWSDDDHRTFDVTIAPLSRPDGGPLGAAISFLDVTRYHRLQEELEQTNRDLEAAYEELQSTNEELETTNEELQSTIEELETTNEELQSSNEELETTNEELQSTNDELHGLNEQLELRGGDLDRANLHLQGILTGLHLGIVVLDRQLTVQLWNDWADDLWGLRATEAVGRSFLNLDIGLPVERLARPIRRCLDAREGQTVQIAARNRRGHEISCRVVVNPLALDDDVAGVILVMEEGPAGEDATHGAKR
jgi:two-component system CheB/CheR fusion protein